MKEIRKAGEMVSDLSKKLNIKSLPKSAVQNTTPKKSNVEGSIEIINVEDTYSLLRIGFFGLSGCGKTYSMLLLAKCLMKNKIGFFATENGYQGACHRLGLGGKARIAPLKCDENGTVSSFRYIQAVRMLEREGCDVICIDSLTPQWSHILQQVHAYRGDPRRAWGVYTPEYNLFLTNLFERGSTHILCTVLGNEKTFQEGTIHGIYDVAPAGIKLDQRKYVFRNTDVVFFMEQTTQKASIGQGKDRTGVFQDACKGEGCLINEELGLKLRAYDEQLNRKGALRTSLAIDDGLALCQEVMAYADNQGMQTSSQHILKALGLSSISDLTPKCKLSKRKNRPKSRATSTKKWR